VKEEIFRYNCAVEIPGPLTDEDMIYCRRQLSLHHMGEELLPMGTTITEELMQAHRYLNVGKGITAEVVVFSDGTRELCTWR